MGIILLLGFLNDMSRSLGQGLPSNDMCKTWSLTGTSKHCHAVNYKHPQ